MQMAKLKKVAVQQWHQEITILNSKSVTVLLDVFVIITRFVPEEATFFKDSDHLTCSTH